MNIYLYGIQETHQHQDNRRPVKTTDVRHVKRKGNTIDIGSEHPAQLYRSEFNANR